MSSSEFRGTFDTTITTSYKNFQEHSGYVCTECLKKGSKNAMKITSIIIAIVSVILLIFGVILWDWQMAHSGDPE